MERILIVDDEQPVRELFKAILEARGYACAMAGSAAEARLSLEAQTFELVLCDIIMPGESGLSFIRGAGRPVCRKSGPNACFSVPRFSRLIQSSTYPRAFRLD